MTRLEQIVARNVDQDGWADEGMMLTALRELSEELAKKVEAKAYMSSSVPLMLAAVVFSDLIRHYGDEQVDLTERGQIAEKET